MSRRRRNPQSATSLEMAPEQDERARERRYLITMGIRMGCFALAVFIQPYGWHTAALAIGAVFLPWFAVVAANVRSSVRVDHAVAPEAQALGPAPERDGADDDEEEILLREAEPGGPAEGPGSGPEHAPDEPGAASDDAGAAPDGHGTIPDEGPHGRGGAAA